LALSNSACGNIQITTCFFSEFPTNSAAVIAAVFPPYFQVATSLLFFLYSSNVGSCHILSPVSLPASFYPATPDYW